uniref:SUN domain-containing protein n=2 Tax=Clastoptera arizonana TaxID=38151 RepID=A0A1B6DYA5_9HEMI
MFKSAGSIYCGFKMKRALLCVYSSLLFIFLLSSGLLFVLVTAELDSNDTQTIDLSLLGDSLNIDTELQDDIVQGGSSNLVKDNSPEEIHSSFDDPSVNPLVEPEVEVIKQTDPTILLHEASTNQGISESGEGAVIYTLVDSATSELQKQAAASSIPSQKETLNKSIPLTVPLPLPTESDAPNTTHEHYVVRAEPKVRHEPILNSPNESETETVSSAEEQLGDDSNSTEPLVDTSTLPPAAHEDIPSFSEWAQKQLEEAEKNKDENTTGGGAHPQGSALKIRNKNYASPDCGAKVVASNPEAVSAGSLLSSSRDEYMLNTCTSRIWFIVELCEAIQPRKIELGNFELFSSSPKDFTVSLSDRFPSREWTTAGVFTAQDERHIQPFNLQQSNFFGKFVKVEIHSHYGSEHYCPVSLFRMYGTSEFEVLDTVEEAHHPSTVIDDDDDDEELAGEDGDAPKNLFGSARDAVLSIVKKAAEALAKPPEETVTKNVVSNAENLTEDKPAMTCVTPCYIVVCDNCPDHIYSKVYDLLSCEENCLDALLQSDFLRTTLANSDFCSGLGLDLRSGAPYPENPIMYGSKSKAIDYLKSLVLPEYLAALCNILAINQKKVVLNITNEVIQDINQTLLSNNNIEEILIKPASTCGIDTSIPDLTPNTPHLVTSIPTFSNNAGYVPVGQIKPTKTLNREQDILAPVETIYAKDTTVENNESTVKPLVLHVVTTVLNDTKEPNQENIPIVIDNITILDMTDETASLDSLFSELEKAVVPNLPTPTTVSPPQKESVFVRLANRIKTLERNMSLSGQYLEELSRRYKRQVEEMQKALVAAADERKRGEEREERTGEQLVQLSEKVAQLTLALENLINERDSWQNKASLLGQHGLIIVAEVLVFGIILYICRLLPNVDVTKRKFSVGWQRGSVPVRRKSVDDTAGNSKPKAKKRRPSEEALKISGSTHHELLINDVNYNKISKAENRRRRKRRKESAVKLSSGPNALDHIDINNRLFFEQSNDVMPWWSQDVQFNENTSVPVITKNIPDKVLPPDYVQTAVSQRQDRLSRSGSSEVVTVPSHPIEQKPTFLPIKKPGPFKKIVKKFF